MTDATPEFNRGAAITRSMLGWGVVAGPFYLAFGLVLAFTQAGFDITRDALSLLLLTDVGWLQFLNLVLSGIMTTVAALGLYRTPKWPRTAAVLVGFYGLCLVLSAIFPPGNDTAGLLHFVFGGLGFFALGIAAFTATHWLGEHWQHGALFSRLMSLVIIIAFATGGALSATAPGVGVTLIWLAVLAIWTWLAVASITAYRAVPHPDAARH